MNSSAGRVKIRLKEVNDRAQSDAKEFFEECDLAYETKINAIARKIAEGIGQTRLIMLSGPSSSTKTTTSLKIQHKLREINISAVTISMDDFFKGRNNVPVLPDGSRDFESLEALNLGLLKGCLSELILNGRSDLPVFDFKAGYPAEKKRHVELAGDSVAIVEGLHALDSRITDEMPNQRILKLYVSASSDFADEDGGTVLTARDVRLVRRTIRDYKYRGSGPENTLDMWDAVCRGEDLYVRPFKKTADIVVNSVFKCEPCLFRTFAIRLLKTVPQSSRYYRKASQVIAGLSRFREMPMSLVPDTCVLREFTGGSVYYRK